MSEQAPEVRRLGRPGAGGRSALDRWLAGDDHLLGGLRPLVGPLPVLTVPGGPPPAGGWSSADLAAAEVAALRADPGTLAPSTGRVRSRRALVRLLRRRGQGSVEAWRADTALLPRLQLGSWWNAGWRSRLLRRVLLATGVPAALLPPRVAADVAFWRGVRRTATATEWARLTRSSYVVLCYHRLDGSAPPGQERMDVAPRALRHQLRLLRGLGWRPLGPADLVAFHDGSVPVLPRRRYVVTADDGFVDAVGELGRHPEQQPQLFAVTTAVGGTADWLDQVPVSGWDDLERVDRAGSVGSHARHHVRLDRLGDAELATELGGSLDDLQEHLPGGTATRLPLLAYPHGGHDLRVREAARAAGYVLAYTTRQGRNGAGTDRWLLRRVEPKAWDRSASFLWKVLTGESPPARWERRLEARWRSRSGR